MISLILSLSKSFFQASSTVVERSFPLVSVRKYVLKISFISGRAGSRLKKLHEKNKV